MTSAALSWKEKEIEEISYNSEGLEATLTRWRCSRIAAITIGIRAGVSNICSTERNEKSEVSPHR
jgi:hypothetical protein